MRNYEIDFQEKSFYNQVDSLSFFGTYMGKFNTIEDFENHIKKIKLIPENELNEIDHKLDKSLSIFTKGVIVGMALISIALIGLLLNNDFIAIASFLCAFPIVFITSHFYKKKKKKYAEKYNTDQFDVDFNKPIAIDKLALLLAIDNPILKSKLDEICQIRGTKVLKVDYDMLKVDDNLTLLGVTSSELLENR